MFIKRNVVVINYKDLDSEFLRPEQILVKLDDAVKVRPLDLGSWAYCRREKAVAWRGRTAVFNERYSGLSVEESSIQKERIEFIRGFLDLNAISAWRPITFSEIFCNISRCLGWCDTNGHSSLFSSKEASRDAYFSHTNFIDSEVKLGKIKPRTAASRQAFFRRMIRIYWTNSASDIFRGIPSFFYNKGDRDLPYEREFGQYIDVTLALSTQISAAIIEGQPFPWVISFDSYNANLFPSHRPPKTPFNLNVPLTRHPTEPRYKTIDEYLEGTPKKDKDAIYSKKFNFKRSKAKFEESNADSRSYFRMLNASKSMVAYLVMLQIITGAPASELLRVEYSEDEYSLENYVIKKELSSIKFRAAGKTVRYPLGDAGMHILKQYLKLRLWVLDGESYPYLFFKLSRSLSSDSWSFERIYESFSWSFTNRIRGVYLPKETPNIAKFGRQYKSMLLHVLNRKPEVIASLLNHTEMTNSSSYSNVSPDVYQGELSAYWESIRAAVSVVKEQKGMSKPIAGGHCDSFESPSPIIVSPPIEPNCKVQQSCLYCENYVCHSDEIDVHKLLSLQYVAHQIRMSSADVQHSEELFKDLTIRIEYILDEVRSRSTRHSDLVKRMKKRVFELGQLTSFWERRMVRYEKMGVIA
jgi:integrase